MVCLQVGGWNDTVMSSTQREERMEWNGGVGGMEWNGGGGSDREKKGRKQFAWKSEGGMTL